jgi:hypothetical protein
MTEPLIDSSAIKASNDGLGIIPRSLEHIMTAFKHNDFMK